MTINDIDEKNVSTSESEDKTVIGTPTSSIDPNIKLQPIAEVLGGDMKKDSKELSAINDFIMKENPEAKMEDVAWACRELLLRLGTPRFGESNMDRLYQYVFLRTEKDNIDKKLDILGGKK